MDSKVIGGMVAGSAIGIAAAVMYNNSDISMKKTLRQIENLAFLPQGMNSKANKMMKGVKKSVDNIID